MASCFKIDIHTHILPAIIPDFAKKFGYGGFVTLDNCSSCGADMVKDGEVFRRVKPNCYDLVARVDDYSKSGVNVQVLSTVPVMFSYFAKPKDCLDICRYLNDDIAEAVAKYPNNFIGLGVVPMQDPELAAIELTRCVEELGLKGVEIGSHINEWNLNEPCLDVFYEQVEKLNAAIFVHPWDMMGAERLRDYWLPWLVSMPAETSAAICSMIFGGVFQRFPNLRVAFAHGGGSFPATFGRICHGFEVRPDLCAVDNKVHPREYLGKFWVDSLVHHPFALQLIISLFGEDKVVFGSDYPFPLGELNGGKLIEETVTNDKVKEKIFYKNACSWLGIAPEHFQ